VSITRTAADFTVCPFTVACDQREKAPFSFTGMRSILSGRRGGGGAGENRVIVKIETKFLDTGDYSIIGFEDRVSVERKSLEDLYSTIGQHRTRFEIEFQRLSKMDVAAVVIEAAWRDVWSPAAARGAAWRSRLNPASVLGTIQQWIVRYPNVHWFAGGSRRGAEKATFLFLERWWREHKGNPLDCTCAKCAKARIAVETEASE
jgi:DNA excision repair protein ERCC-4